jgi:hypothetical protein
VSLLVALLLAAQSEADLARKCGSQIPWLRDGTELVDMELAAGHHPQYPDARPARFWKADRAALLDRAFAAAREKNRPVLWYVPRVAGLHMYRAILPDRAMDAVVWTDPGVVDLVNAGFVPLRMCADEETKKAFGWTKPFQVVEPAIVVLSPDRKVLHQIDRIRTFNAHWFHVLLARVLGRPEPPAPPPLIERRFPDPTSPEALYTRAAIDAWSGRDPAPALRAVVQARPDSPWAWRAALNLVKADDSLPEGPLAHHLEDSFAPPPVGLPTTTRSPAASAEVAVRGAVDFLLRAQHADGAWRDARYAYWPDPRILPNVWGAITALAALALHEWRDVAPDRIDAALRKADAFLQDESHFARGHHEESYALAYRLHYFAARRDESGLRRVVGRLAETQDADGHWPHEYQNPFSTAAVVHALTVAKRAGADVPDILYRRAADALLSTRGELGRQSYRVGEKPDPEKNSMSRTALCELALYECNRGPLANVEQGLADFWKYLERLEAVRLCDYHSDGRLAGFFYFHAGLHTLEAARAVGGPAHAEARKRFRERMLQIPEIDGSFVDSHEIGKSYGSASALLILARCRE